MKKNHLNSNEIKNSLAEDKSLNHKRKMKPALFICLLHFILISFSCMHCCYVCFRRKKTFDNATRNKDYIKFLPLTLFTLFIF